MARNEAAQEAIPPLGVHPRSQDTSERIALSAIRVDGGTQARVRLDERAVGEYAEAYQDGEPLPPVVVYYDGDNYWLVDGFHRHAAALQAELAEIDAEVRHGGLRDAILASVGANARHGVRRTRRDKRKAVGILLADPEWSGWSDRAIARACQVSNRFVSNLRKERGGSTVNVHSRSQTNADNSAVPSIDASAAPDGSDAPTSLEGATSTLRVGQDGRAYNVTNLQARARPLQPEPVDDPPNEGEGEDWYPPADEPCPARLDGRTCDDCPEDEPHHWEIYRPAGESPLQVCKHCRTVGATLDDEPEPEPALEAPAPAVVVLPAPQTDGELPNDQRAPNDGYWTPDAHALACCRWMAEQGLFSGTGEVLEPSIGGGAWARAVAEVWPETTVHGLDIDPGAPGLQLVERRQVGDFLTARVPERDLIIGNPPYDPATIMAWLDRSLQRASVVAYLLRETLTGTKGRRQWWQEEHRPDWIAKLDTRPKWEGPGARSTADFADSVLVVWIRRVRGLNTRTRFDWIEVPGGE